MSLKPMKPLMGKKKMTNNEKIALKWALENVKPNNGLMVSDKFWTGLSDSDKIRKSTTSLFLKYDIIIFWLGKESAILIHKNNPYLSYTEKYNEEGELWGWGEYKSTDGESMMMLQTHTTLN